MSEFEISPRVMSWLTENPVGDSDDTEDVGLVENTEEMKPESVGTLTFQEIIVEHRNIEISDIMPMCKQMELDELLLQYERFTKMSDINEELIYLSEINSEKQDRLSEEALRDHELIQDELCQWKQKMKTAMNSKENFQQEANRLKAEHRYNEIESEIIDQFHDNSKPEIRELVQEIEDQREKMNLFTEATNADFEKLRSETEVLIEENVKSSTLLASLRKELNDLKIALMSSEDEDESSEDEHCKEDIQGYVDVKDETITGSTDESKIVIANLNAEKKPAFKFQINSPTHMYQDARRCISPETDRVFRSTSESNNGANLSDVLKDESNDNDTEQGKESPPDITNPMPISVVSDLNTCQEDILQDNLESETHEEPIYESFKSDASSYSKRTGDGEVIRNNLDHYKHFEQSKCTFLGETNQLAANKSKATVVETSKSLHSSQTKSKIPKPTSGVPKRASRLEYRSEIRKSVSMNEEDTKTISRTTAQANNVVNINKYPNAPQRNISTDSESLKCDKVPRISRHTRNKTDEKSSWKDQGKHKTKSSTKHKSTVTNLGDCPTERLVSSRKLPPVVTKVNKNPSTKVPPTVLNQTLKSSTSQRHSLEKNMSTSTPGVNSNSKIDHTRTVQPTKTSGVGIRRYTKGPITSYSMNNQTGFVNNKSDLPPIRTTGRTDNKTIVKNKKLPPIPKQTPTISTSLNNKNTSDALPPIRNKPTRVTKIEVTSTPLKKSKSHSTSYIQDIKQTDTISKTTVIDNRVKKSNKLKKNNRELDTVNITGTTKSLSKRRK